MQVTGEGKRCVRRLRFEMRKKPALFMYRFSARERQQVNTFPLIACLTALMVSLADDLKSASSILLGRLCGG